MENEFAIILEKERNNEVVPFLKKLSDADKKTLLPHLKKLSKEYSGFEEIPNGKNVTTLKLKATEEQRKILTISCFVCYTRKEFEKIWSSWVILEKEILNSIISWYCPDWFSDFVNNYAHDEHLPGVLNYDLIMEMTERGYLRPSKELIARLTPMLIYERVKGYKCSYYPENLLKRVITLKEHLWYLFEMESNIYSCDRFLGMISGISKETCNWIQVLKKYSSEKRIDRTRLLKESLLATNRNFNKLASGWFMDLFIELDPSDQELFLLQDELFTALNSSNSKVVNAILTFFKKMIDHQDMRVDAFVDQLSILLSVETKSVVVSTIAITEKIAKKYKDKQEIICLNACHAFISKDDDIQLKAAKLIKNYTNEVSAELKNELIANFEYMKSSVKEMFKDVFLTEKQLTAPAEMAESTIDTELISETNKIKTAENFDELLFLASQAFDNNQTYHIDLLPASLINLQQHINKDNVMKLEPAIQRANKILHAEVRGNLGYLDHLLANFMIAFAGILMKNFPDETKELKKKYNVYDLGNWESPEYMEEEYKEIMFETHKQILKGALSKLSNQDTLPLLSTPTHSPSWISSIALINRLSEYQSGDKKPESFDFQVAISRCAFDNKADAVKLVQEKLNGEYRNLLLFLLLENGLPKAPFINEAAWIIAGVTKSPKMEYPEFENFVCNKLNQVYLSGWFPWKTFVEKHIYTRYNYTTKKNEKVKDDRKTIQIEFPDRWKTNKDTVPKEEKLIYDFVHIKSSYGMGVAYNDIQRILLLTPSNPEPMLAHIFEKCFRHPNSWDESNKRFATNAVEILHAIWGTYGEMAHLFVATCMIGNDKTIRSFGAEIWIKGVNHANIKSELIGEILGKHERIEFAPVKRLTDVIMSNMLQISERHNRELEVMLVALLNQLPAEPITNLKKLLEVYSEVVSLNRSAITSEKLKEQLSLWKKSATVSKLIKALDAKIK